MSESFEREMGQVTLNTDELARVENCKNSALVQGGVVLFFMALPLLLGFPDNKSQTADTWKALLVILGLPSLWYFGRACREWGRNEVLRDMRNNPTIRAALGVNASASSNPSRPSDALRSRT